MISILKKLFDTEYKELKRFMGIADEIEALSDEYIVLKAANGKEAIKHLTDRKYDIVGILLDLNMPESDGFVVLNYFGQKYFVFHKDK